MKEFFYVSVIDGKRTGFLLGPYDTHQEALNNVERGRNLAHESDGSTRSWFYSYGTVKLTHDDPVVSVFGV